MPTTVRTLMEEDKGSHEMLHDFCIAAFLEGECYAFAIALHEGLDWPMYGLMVKGLIRHAAAMDRDRRLWDARGPVPAEVFGHPFGVGYPFKLEPVSVADLVRIGEPEEVRERTVRSARRFAECLWPDLPWKGSLASRVTAFADELEALSRKHRLWIRAPLPAMPPMLAMGEDDELGYLLRPTFDGATFSIERHLS